MDGIHDMGGMQGFPAVAREDDEPVFHSNWERRVFGMTNMLPVVIGGSDDQFRRDMERMPPIDYLRSSYYEKWLFSLETLAGRAGLLSEAEIAAGKAIDPVPEAYREAQPARAEEVWDAIHAGASQAMPEAEGVAQRFEVGARVLTKPVMGFGHTRLPRYARNRVGTIESAHGSFILADAHAATDKPAADFLYTVVFEARDLWGEEAAAGDSLTLDLWDSYLLPAPE